LILPELIFHSYVGLEKEDSKEPGENPSNSEPVYGLNIIRPSEENPCNSEAVYGINIIRPSEENSSNSETFYGINIIRSSGVSPISQA
jgi:hypothetical protein